MNKLQQVIYITATKVDIKDNKIIAINGEFYFQGKKYLIDNGCIVNEPKKEEIPF